MPPSVPTKPIIAPCTRKIRATRRGSSPQVRRIAMSFCLSITTIISDATMLNAATPTMNIKMIRIIIFSMWIALNRLRWSSAQSE